MVVFREEAGSILETEGAIVIPVSCVGDMVAGLAGLCEAKYPGVRRFYQEYCATVGMRPGNIVTYYHNEHHTILLFPTTEHWSMGSHISLIAKGLFTLRAMAPAVSRRGMAIPALGCGIGGLEWSDVKQLIQKSLQGVRCDIVLYGPK